MVEYYKFSNQDLKTAYNKAQLELSAALRKMIFNKELNEMNIKIEAMKKEIEFRKQKGKWQE